MVKKNRQTPFNAKPQTLQKYQAILNTQSSLEATASTADEGIPASGTAAPKEENNQQVTTKRQKRKGQRYKGKNFVMDLIKNPITWALVTACVWGANITYSLNGVQTSISKMAEKFDQFSENAVVKLESIQQYLRDGNKTPSNEKQVGNNKEFNLFNFSRERSK